MNVKATVACPGMISMLTMAVSTHARPQGSTSASSLLHGRFADFLPDLRLQNLLLGPLR